MQARRIAGLSSAHACICVHFPLDHAFIPQRTSTLPPPRTPSLFGCLSHAMRGAPCRGGRLLALAQGQRTEVIRASIGTHTPAPSRARLGQQSTILDTYRGKSSSRAQSGAPAGHLQVHRLPSCDHCPDKRKMPNAWKNALFSPHCLMLQQQALTSVWLYQTTPNYPHQSANRSGEMYKTHACAASALRSPWGPSACSWTVCTPSAGAAPPPTSGPR